MSKPEGHTDHLVSPVAQAAAGPEDTMASLPDDSPSVLTIRPAPGHPFASLSVCDQQRARQPEPLIEEAGATWANLHDLAHEWGSFACTLASLSSPASAHVFQAIGMAFLALSHEESAYAHYFLLGNRLRYPHTSSGVVSSTHHNRERPATTPGPPTPSIPRISPTSLMNAAGRFPRVSLPVLPRPLMRGSTIVLSIPAPAVIVAAR